MRLGHRPLDRLTGKLRRNPFIATYTRGLTSEDLQRLFTRDTIEAYRFFARGIDPAEIARLPWPRRLWAHVRLFFLAFTLKLSPARRAVYGIGVIAELIGLFQLARLGTGSLGNVFPHGTFYVLLGFVITNLLVLVGVLCGLGYFFFSARHEGVLGRMSTAGIWLLMVGFGASFGYTVMSRVSLLYGRVNFLIFDWAKPLLRSIFG